MLRETGIVCPCCNQRLLFDDAEATFASEGLDAPCPHVAAINASWSGGEEGFRSEEEQAEGERQRGGRRWWDSSEDELDCSYNHPGYPRMIEYDEGPACQQRESNVPSWSCWSDATDVAFGPLFFTALFSLDPAALADEEADAANARAE
jgi:hypothetical protein